MRRTTTSRVTLLWRDRAPHLTYVTLDTREVRAGTDDAVVPSDSSRSPARSGGPHTHRRRHVSVQRQQQACIVWSRLTGRKLPSKRTGL
jgi:hypothetical protein